MNSLRAVGYESGKIESDDAKDRWSNFKNLVCKKVKDVLGRKVRKAAKNVSKNIWCLKQEKGVL